MPRIAPGDGGQYFDGLRKKGLSVATRKQHLAAVRHFFDGMERYEVIEGKAPAISVAHVGYRTQRR